MKESYYSQEVKHYSSGAYRDVEIYDTYVIKKPKANDDCEEYFTNFGIYDEDKCESCPFKERCHNLLNYHYEMDSEDFEKECKRLERETEIENIECDNYYWDLEHNDEYVGEEEGYQCCMEEINIWEQCKGHRGGLCDIINYDKTSGEIMMKKAKIAGENYNVYSILNRIKIKFCYSRHLKKRGVKSVRYAGARLSKKQRKEFQKLIKILNKHEWLCDFDDMLIFAILEGFDYKPLLDTLKFCRRNDIYIDDMHYNNWGILNGRIVITDYGNTN